MEFQTGMRVIHKHKKITGTLIRKTIQVHRRQPVLWRVMLDEFSNNIVTWEEQNLMPADGTNREVAEFLLMETEETLF